MKSNFLSVISLASACVLGLSSAAFGAATATLEQDRAVLRNEFIEIAFVPGKGARCVSFKYLGTQFENSPWGSFEERLWETKGYDFPGVSFQASILQAGPETASIAFHANASTPGYTKLELTRVVTLRAGRSDIEVTATFKNNDKQALPVGYWVFMDFQIPGKENIVTIPSLKGLDRLYFSRGTIPSKDPRNVTVVGNERWLYDIPRGFIGWNSADGPGLVITMDLSRLSMLYNFLTGTDFTSELAFNEVPVEPGKELRYTYVLLPFHGLPSVDGAQGNVAVSLEAPKDMTSPGASVARVTVVSGEAREVALQLRAQLLPNGAWASVGEKKPLSLKSDTPGQAQFDWMPAAEGTYALGVQVLEKANVVADAEKPVVVGKASAVYAMASDVQRIGKEMTKYREATTAHQEDPEVMKETVKKFHFLRDIDESYVTPHIAFAKPLAGGPVRVLFLPSWFCGREVVEIAQRLDVKYSHVAILFPASFGPMHQKGKGPISVLEAAMVEKLKGNAQVIAFSSCPCAWKDFQPETRNALLDAVKGGKGLVYTGDVGPVLQDMGKEFIEDAAAAKGLTAAMPATARAGNVRTGAYGKGRVVLLGFGASWRGNCLIWSATCGGITKLNDPARESACSLTARSLLWAARRDPSATLSLAEGLSLTSEATLGSRIQATLTGNGISAVDWFIQPPEDVAPMAMPRLPAAQAASGLALPHLATGKYAVYAIARNAKGAVIDWAASSVIVTTDVGVSVQLDKPRYEVQDTAVATVTVSNAVAAVTGGKSARKGVSVQCELLDVKGRLLSRQAQPLEDKSKVEFRLPLALSAAKMIIVRATLLIGDGPLTSGEATASVRIPRDKDFLYILYAHFGREGAELTGAQSLMGNSEKTARFNLDNYIWGSIPDFYRDMPFPPDQLVRTPCLSDPAYIQKCSESIRERAKTMALYGDMAMIISDEWNYAGRGAAVANICHSPTCQAAFRKHLQAEYKTVEALNASWGSAFKTWEEVDAPRREEVIASRNFVPWIDKRRSQETVVADFLKALARAGKEVYPDFRLSLSGTHNPGDIDGYDWWKLMHALDAVSLYGGPQVQISRSFARPDQLLTEWHGYDTTDSRGLHVAYELWAKLFMGLGGACDFATITYSPLFWPDYSPRNYGKASAEGFQALQQGPGPLISNAIMDDDGVAILYSHRSVHLAAVEGMLGKPVGAGTYVDTLSSLEALLRDLGFQFRYVADEQLTEGILRDGKYRLLIVPFSEALSPEEAAVIRQFAEAGGVVLADMCPALTDQHGKPYPVSPLDGLFGVKRAKHVTTFRQGDVTVAEQPQYGLKEATLKLVLGEEDLALDGATAWASFKNAAGETVPAVVARAVGKGRGILLNFGVADYQGYRSAGVGGEVSVVNRARAEKTEALQALVRAVLASAGLSPRVVLSATPVVDSGFLTRFRSGEAVFLGMGSDPKESHTLRFALDGLQPSKRHIYNVRAHKYLGEAASFNYTMKNSFAEIIALMPGRIGDLSLKASASSTERGKIVSLALKVSDWKPDMGRPVFHVEVRRPDGAVDKLYTKNIVGDNGAAQMAIPFALNDPTGEWSIEAKEVISGNSDRARVTVK